MIRVADFSFIIFIAFNFVVVGYSLHIYYPAKVSINKPRSLLNNSYSINIEAACKTWNLQLVQLQNIWSGPSDIVNVTQNENETSIREMIKRIQVYHDPKVGSVLSVTGNEVRGILNSEYSIVIHNDTHLIKKLIEQKGTRDIKDVLITNNKSMQDYKEHLLSRTSKKDNFGNKFRNYPDKRSLWANPSFAIDVLLDAELVTIIGDNELIATYLTTFWNYVIKIFINMDSSFKIDLHYGGLEHFQRKTIPNYKLPFIDNNAQKLEVQDMIHDLSQWTSNKYGDLYYEDILYVHTNKDLKDKGHPNITGVAIAIGGICEDIAMSVAIGEDHGAEFTGVRTAAHELAHIFGAIHDFDDNPCNPDDGYIMGYRGYVEANLYKFSSCSKQNIKTTVADSWVYCEERKIRYMNKRHDLNLSTTFDK